MDTFLDVVVVLDSWVVLQNSDIVPADLAAAAAGSSPTIPNWYELGFGEGYTSRSVAKSLLFVQYSFCVTVTFSQGAVGSWRRGAHSCAILQENQACRRYMSDSVWVVVSPKFPYAIFCPPVEK